MVMYNYVGTKKWQLLELVYFISKRILFCIPWDNGGVGYGFLVPLATVDLVFVGIV